MSERITSAALNLGGVILSLPSPARHHHIINLAVPNFKLEPPSPASQGFITSTGRYVSRREAFWIATDAGQMMDREERSGPPDLYSEDLW